MDMFIELIIVMVSQMYKLTSNFIKLYALNMYTFCMLIIPQWSVLKIKKKLSPQKIREFFQGKVEYNFSYGVKEQN